MSARSVRSGPGRSFAAGVAGVALVVTLAACSPTPADPAEPPPTEASIGPVESSTTTPSPTPTSTDTATPSITASPTPFGTPSATPLTPPPASAPAPSATDPNAPNPNAPNPSSTGGPPVLDRSAAGRDLRVADFFAAPVEWRDGTYDVASERALPGVSGTLRRCNAAEADAQTFELRLANNFSRVSMRVGLANNSENSDAEVLVRLVGNGTFIDSTQVRFNKLQDVAVPVTGVNALKLELFMTGKKCDEDKTVNAVIASLRLE